MIVRATCPRCGEEVEAEVTTHRGDLVPYGSTTARLPATADLDYDHDCPGLDRDGFTALDCALWDAFDEAEANREPESQYDTLEERDM